jgi:hypothetical protein
MDMKMPLSALPCHALHAHLSLRESGSPQTVTAWAALITASSNPHEGTKIRPSWDARAVSNYHINFKHDVKQVYFSPTVYNEAFEEIQDMTGFFTTALPSGGMQFIMVDRQLILEIISKGTLCAKIRNWRSQLKGAWLISINGSPVSTVAEVNSALDKSLRSENSHCTLLFSHPKIRHGLMNKGIPQITLDLFDSFQLPTPPLCRRNCIQRVWDGKVLHYVTKA